MFQTTRFQSLFAPVAFLCFGLFSGCLERTIYLDYPVIYEDTVSVNKWEGDPVLIPGIYEEQLFNEFEEGDDLYIIQGFQGGIWVHLSIRVGGLDSSGVIYAKLGNDIGEIEYNIKLVRSGDGYLEAYDIPVPVGYDGEELEKLYGTESFIEIEYTSGDQTLSVVRTVTLREG